MVIEGQVKGDQVDFNPPVQGPGRCCFGDQNMVGVMVIGVRGETAFAPGEIDLQDAFCERNIGLIGIPIQRADFFCALRDGRCQPRFIAFAFLKISARCIAIFVQVKENIKTASGKLLFDEDRFGNFVFESAIDILTLDIFARVICISRRVDTRQHEDVKTSDYIGEVAFEKLKHGFHACGKEDIRF